MDGLSTIGGTGHMASSACFAPLLGRLTSPSLLRGFTSSFVGHAGPGLFAHSAPFFGCFFSMPFCNYSASLFGRLTVRGLFHRCGSLLERHGLACVLRQRQSLFIRHIGSGLLTRYAALLKRHTSQSLFRAEASLLWGSIGAGLFSCRALLSERQSGSALASIRAVHETRTVSAIERYPAALGVGPAIARSGFNGFYDRPEPDTHERKNPLGLVVSPRLNGFADVVSQSRFDALGCESHITNSSGAWTAQRVDNPVHFLFCPENPGFLRFKNNANVPVLGAA